MLSKHSIRHYIQNINLADARCLGEKEQLYRANIIRVFLQGPVNVYYKTFINLINDKKQVFMAVLQPFASKGSDRWKQRLFKENL